MTESGILQLSVRRGVGTDEVRADGELDVASTEELGAVLRRAVREARAVELDLGGVFFCDVLGVRTLTECACNAARAGVALHVRGVQGELARVLGLLRVTLPA